MASDIVHCNGLELSVEIGFHAVELGVKQKLEVDLTLEDLNNGPDRDEMTGLVDYYEISRRLIDHVATRRYALVEALAVDLAREVIRMHPTVRARVRVTKRPLDMPYVRSVGVECVRTAADFAERGG